MYADKMFWQNSNSIDRMHFEFRHVKDIGVLVIVCCFTISI